MSLGFSLALPSPVRNLCANPLGELDEGVERRLVHSVASEDRELFADELHDGGRRQRHRPLPSPLAIEEDGRGLMTRRGIAYHHELGLLPLVGALDAATPDMPLAHTPLHARAHR